MNGLYTIVTKIKWKTENTFINEVSIHDTTEHTPCWGTPCWGTSPRFTHFQQNNKIMNQYIYIFILDHFATELYKLERVDTVFFKKLQGNNSIQKYTRMNIL